MRGILAPGNDHLEPDDGLTEAPGEEEEENDKDLASLPELISSEEEDEVLIVVTQDEQVLIDGMVVTLTQNGTSLTPLHIVNGALGRVVRDALGDTRECNAVAT